MKEETSEEDLSFIPPKSDDKISRNFRKRNRKKEKRSPEKIVFHDKEPSFKWLLKLSLIGILLIAGAGIAWIWDDHIYNGAPISTDNEKEAELLDSKDNNNEEIRDNLPFWSNWFGILEDTDECDEENIALVDDIKPDKFENRNNYKSDDLERSDVPPEYSSPQSYQEAVSNDFSSNKDLEEANTKVTHNYDNVDHQDINQVNSNHENNTQSFSEETQIPSDNEHLTSDHQKDDPWLWKQDYLDDIEYYHKLEVDQVEKARKVAESLGEEARRMEEPQNKEAKNVKLSEFIECYEGNNECENVPDREHVNLDESRLELHKYDEQYDEFSETNRQINQDQDQDQRNFKPNEEIYSTHKVNTEHQFEFDPSKESENEEMLKNNFYSDINEENLALKENNENNEKQRVNIDDDEMQSDDRLNTDESINSINNGSTTENHSDEPFEGNGALYYW